MASQPNALPSVDDLAKRVLHDASDLIASMGIVAPLMQGDLGHNLADVPDEKRDVALFLQAQLARQVVLLIVRLHEPRNDKDRTGATVSIPALVAYGLEEHRLTADAANAIQDHLKAAVSLYDSSVGHETYPVTFEALRTFRNAEIAHSIHRWPGLGPKDLPWGSVATLAYDTYEVVLEVCQAVGRAADADDFHRRYDRGIAFWR
jgi:hypothetical protein